MKTLLVRLLAFLKRNNYSSDLRINGRKKLPNSEFRNSDCLYHGFDNSDYDINNNIILENIRFSDFFCNWSSFSKPEYLCYRQNGKITDGCYSFTVEIARFKGFATPVHDPINDKHFPNYFYVEVRILYDGEDILYEPSRNRKSGKSKIKKSKRMEYRQNILNNLIIEIEPN